MSQENVEIVRRGYEAFNRGDYEGMLTELAPDAEYVSSGVIADAGASYRGLEEIGRRFREGFWGQFDDARMEIHELIDVGDRVLVAVTAWGRGKQSGVETSVNLWHVWTLRDGKAVRGQSFAGRAEAIETLGLRE